jgi:hypothetical protein
MKRMWTLEPIEAIFFAQREVSSKAASVARNAGMRTISAGTILGGFKKSGEDRYDWPETVRYGSYRKFQRIV